MDENIKLKIKKGNKNFRIVDLPGPICISKFGSRASEKTPSNFDQMIQSRRQTFLCSFEMQIGRNQQVSRDFTHFDFNQCLHQKSKSWHEIAWPFDRSFVERENSTIINSLNRHIWQNRKSIKWELKLIATAGEEERFLELFSERMEMFFFQFPAYLQTKTKVWHMFKTRLSTKTRCSTTGESRQTAAKVARSSNRFSLTLKSSL